MAPDAQNSRFQDFRVEHDFPGIGHKVMYLSACRIDNEDEPPQQILLAFKVAGDEHAN